MLQMYLNYKYVMMHNEVHDFPFSFEHIMKYSLALLGRLSLRGMCLHSSCLIYMHVSAHVLHCILF